MIDCGHVAKGTTAWEGTQQLVCGVTDDEKKYIIRHCVVCERRQCHSS